jgi:membrane-associated protein
VELLTQFIDIFLHVDEHLVRLVALYGVWIYAILFVIVFCETGLVVTPFLPGDSLLFATGALCALDSGGLSLGLTVPLLIAAAVLGDAVNYRVGYFVGPGFLERKLSDSEKPSGLARFIKREHLVKTQRFYERYGGKTIILARFVPIVRTFAPFVAGIGNMTYRRFFAFNVIGAIAWVLICVLAGYVFGELPFVKKNFELVVLGIIFVSILPLLVEAVRSRLNPSGGVPA